MLKNNHGTISSSKMLAHKYIKPQTLMLRHF